LDRAAVVALADAERGPSFSSPLARQACPPTIAADRPVGTKEHLVPLQGSTGSSIAESGKRKCGFATRRRCMNRETLFEHLLQAAQHADESERRIVKQQALIADLDKKGFDTIEAHTVLAIFHDAQTVHLQDVARIVKEIQRLRGPF
jgi:DNA-directed RNA polymerase specialized sigma54-like protein